MTHFEKPPVTSPERLALYVAWHKGSAWKAYVHRTVPFQRMIASLASKGYLDQRGGITRAGVELLTAEERF